MTRARRSLCGAADIKGWSGRLVPEQIRAQQALVDVMLSACRQAGLPEEIVQSNGDGVLILPPSGIDESAAIPGLVNGLRDALRQENRMLAENAQIRLRFALTSGLVTPGPAGFSGAAIVECFRLLDSPPVKAALVDFPDAQLAVAVSDQLYQDVIRNDYSGLRAEEFWFAHSTMPDRGFSAPSWIYVSDRTGGPAHPGSAPADPVEKGELPAELAEARKLVAEGDPRRALALLDRLAPRGGEEGVAFLDVRADALILLGDFRRACQDLEELLNLRPDPAVAPAPSALLRLGRSQTRLDEQDAARHTLTFLLEHRPLMPEAHLELGRIERRRGRFAAAQTHLVEGLRLVRHTPDAPENLLDDLLGEIAEIPVIDQSLGP